MFQIHKLIQSIPKLTNSTHLTPPLFAEKIDLTAPIEVIGAINRQRILEDRSKFLKNTPLDNRQVDKSFSHHSLTYLKLGQFQALQLKALQLQALQLKALQLQALQFKALQLQSHKFKSLQLGSMTYDIGVDEVGRGPLYGSVVVCAVILPKVMSGETEQTRLEHTCLAALTDSKKLSEKKREHLYPLIKDQALGYVLVDVPASVIDELNILQATLTGMRLACEELMIALEHSIHIEINGITSHDDSGVFPPLREQKYNHSKYTLLVDGNKIPQLDWMRLSRHGFGSSFSDKVTAQAWVKGDARHTAIAAASVMAKVSRDRKVCADGKRYQGYGLEKHKGYPTQAHIEAIHQLGVLPEHRRSFKPIKDALGLV